MELLEGVSGWIIAVVVAVIFIGTAAGVLLSERRRKRDKDPDNR